MPPATFGCPKCRKSYPREKGYAVPGGFVCDGCSGLVVLRGPGRFERLLGHWNELKKRYSQPVP